MTADRDRHGGAGAGKGAGAGAGGWHVLWRPRCLGVWSAGVVAAAAAAPVAADVAAGGIALDAGELAVLWPDRR